MRFNGSWRPAPGSEGRRWWWLRAARLRFESRGDYVWTVEIFPRVLLAQVGTLAVGGYFVGATALYAWLGRNPHNQVSWPDVAWPWRWSQFHVHRGDTQVLDGREELRRRNYTAAYLNLSFGVARSPANAAGRILLAQMLAGGEPARALRLMEEGRRYSADNLDFVRRLLALYEEQQSRGRALATVEELLARGAALPPAVAEFLQNYRLGLLLSLGRHEQCRQALATLAPSLSPSETRRRLELEAQALVAGGQLPAARQALTRLLEQSGLTPDDWRNVAEISVGLDDAEGVRRALLHLKAEARGKSWPSYVFAYQCWHRLKRPSLRDAAENEFYEYFANSYEATQYFSATLVVLELEEALDRVRRRAVAAGLNDHSFKVHQAELLLRHGEFNRAIQQARTWQNEIVRLPPQRRFYSEFIQQLARAAFQLGEVEQTALLDLLEANRWQARPELYQFAAETLARSGQALASAKLVRKGLELFPYADALLAARALQAAQAVAAEPGAAAKAKAQEQNGADLPGTGPAALAAVDALLARDAWSEARDLLSRLRQAAPRWLATFEAPVQAREIELAILTQDAVVSRGLTRSYLGRFRQDELVAPILALARRLVERQKADDARLLLDEIKSARGTSPAVVAALRQIDLPDDLKSLVASRAAAIAALDGWLAAGDWRGAERLLDRLRDVKPAWGLPARVELRVREIRLRLALHQVPQAVELLRELVLRPGEGRTAVFQLAREYLARDEQTSALVLARELTRLLPDNAAAAKLFDEAQSSRLKAPVGLPAPAPASRPL